MATSDTHEFRPQAVNHIGIQVRNCEKVIETWERMFGIGPWRIREINHKNAEGEPVTTKLAFADLGGISMALIEPPEGGSKFLDTHGEGLHHLGFYVDDVDGEVANLSEQGAKVTMHQPGVCAYLDSSGPGGVIFEVMREPEFPEDEWRYYKPNPTSHTEPSKRQDT